MGVRLFAADGTLPNKAVILNIPATQPVSFPLKHTSCAKPCCNIGCCSHLR